MYTDVSQLQADFKRLLNFAYSKNWRWGQDIEHAGQAIISGEILPDTMTVNGLGDAGDLVLTDYNNPSTSLPWGSSGWAGNWGATSTPSATLPSSGGSLFDIFGQITAAISGGANAYATSYSDILRAQMQVNAMKAQAQAGFVATPTVIPNANAFPAIPPIVIYGGIGLFVLALIKSFKG